MKKNVFILVLLCGLMLSWAAVRAEEKTPIVRTHIESGDIQGELLPDGLALYKGIPYAAPPVGELRWRAPQPVKSWQGVKDVSQWGPLPPQPVTEQFKAEMMSEDCLYLSVTTPASSLTERLPVMVWIHGGGFRTHTYSNMHYPTLAKRGLVVVSIEYRTGSLGFLAHPELTKESSDGHSGNYGLLDQVCALQWVQRNITSFGGDPSNVTIFGESAGGMSVSTLCASRLAKGLFHKAICQSGGAFAPYRDVPRDGYLFYNTQKEEEQLGLAFQKQLGKKSLKQLRRVDALTLTGSEADAFDFWPCVDGYALKDDVYRLYEQGDYNDVPVLLMVNSDEGALFRNEGLQKEQYVDFVRSNFGSYADEVLRRYPAETDSMAVFSAADMMRESLFTWPTYSWATLQSTTGKSPVYTAFLSQQSVVSFGPPVRRGAVHADDIFYLLYFTKEAKTQTEFDIDIEVALAEIMQQYWVNFAKTGDPNADGLPYWPTFDKGKPTTMQFNNGASLVEFPFQDNIRVLDRFFEHIRNQEKSITHNP